MGRTPKPSDTEKVFFTLSPANDVYLLAEAERTRRNITEVFNSELDFARTWGLTPSRLRRFQQEAAYRKMDLSEYVQSVLRDEARKLPRANGSAEKEVSGERHRITFFVTGPNHAFLLHEAMRTGADMSGLVNAKLEFLRSFGLHVDLLAALDAVARDTGDTRREVVLNILRLAAEALPPVEDPPRREVRKRA